ncbi:formyl-coenzyme A transferase Frc [Hyphomonas adhaerens MHS-3]|uniref:Formyl-coenzyme A transferase Frc n=1 Tax=Hyphomonas adhaerens MHS-3 TaxID=1280949 RepID=A0A069E9K6_9PROT|nr:CoA transferase [Hyphomonas adhaerens]KCZ86046.1 formyl-coenzyme A transferase Frc [Hyphomonas adhaerens MHS-3]
MFQDFDLLQIFDKNSSPQACLAVQFAAKIACELGARTYISAEEQGPALAQLSHIEPARVETSPISWAHDTSNGRHRVILRAAQSGREKCLDGSISSVTIELERWQSENTLFAASGLARLLGDPDRAPLVPAANYGAHTIGYAAFAALTAVAAARFRHGRAEQAWLHGEAALAWINWKAAIAGTLGEDLKRQGEGAEWPVLACRDGHVAFVYTERDWNKVIEMIGNPVLNDERFSSFSSRARHRADYMAPIAEWCAGLTKADLAKIFVEREVPGAPVSTIEDLFADPLLTHRNALVRTPEGSIAPALPHRIEREMTGGTPKEDSDGSLPLSGLRVLDLGIITAGAGVSALLADMGATVIKVESDTYPDPFRSWAGAAGGDSPLFKSNNRNKQGITLNLKTDEGLREFLKLAETADIVVENFRRGVLDRLGVTFERLVQANPTILLASISGQGLSGPGAHHTTFGSTLEASSGFASLTSYDDGVPVISGRNLNYPDQTVCLYGAAVIAAQAIMCRHNGVARHLDISQRDCAIYQIGDIIARVADGVASDARPADTIFRRPDAPNMLRCADGEYVAVNCEDPALLEALLSGCPLMDWAALWNAADCAQTLLDAGIGAAVARSGKDLSDAPAIRSAGAFATSPSGDLVKGFPFQLLQTPMRIHSNAPGIGEHTHIILNSREETPHVD